MEFKFSIGDRVRDSITSEKGEVFDRYVHRQDNWYVVNVEDRIFHMLESELEYIRDIIEPSPVTSTCLKDRFCLKCGEVKENCKCGKKNTVISHSIGSLDGIETVTTSTGGEYVAYDQNNMSPGEVFELADKSREGDAVNHPKHYNSGKFEVIDVIEDSSSDESFEGFLSGNVKKYVLRYKLKNGVEDLKKAKWYLEKLIKFLED